MKKKIIPLCVWIAFTVLYVFLVMDTGRSDGANTNWAIEDYVEYYNKEYVGAKGLAEGATDAWSYSHFDDLEKQYKTSYAEIAGCTVVYFVVTIACYHYAFIHKAKEKRS